MVDVHNSPEIPVPMTARRAPRTEAILNRNFTQPQIIPNKEKVFIQP